jgi:hypothetical protein
MVRGNPELTSTQEGWRVRIQKDSGEIFEYRYAHEAQARYFAAIFEMKPTLWPTPDRVIRARTRKRRAEETVKTL